MADVLDLPVAGTVDLDHRSLFGRCVPYNVICRLSPWPNGERIHRRAFTESLADRQSRVYLNVEHNEEQTIGRSVHFEERSDGLYGVFTIKRGDAGDHVLQDLEDGYLPHLSVGFREELAVTGKDGVREVIKGFLGHVSLVSLGAYQDGAKVLQVKRRANLTGERSATPNLDQARARVAYFDATRPQFDLNPVEWRIRWNGRNYEHYPVAPTR